MGPGTWTGFLSALLRRATGAGLVLILAFAVGTGPALPAGAVAAPPPASPAAVRAQVAEVAADVAAFRKKVDAADAAAKRLKSELRSSEARVDSLEQRTDAAYSSAKSAQRQLEQHNALVDSYPGRKAPPSVAASVNARGQAIFARFQSARARFEQAQNQYKAAVGRHNDLVRRGERLRADAEALNAESQQLLAELVRLQSALAQSLIDARSGASAVAPEPGGNPAPPPTAADRGVQAPQAGGDPAPEHAAAEAIQDYASGQGGTVDPHPADVILSPPPAAAPGASAGAPALPVSLPADALVRQPSGDTTGVVATPDGKLPDEYKAFNRAVGSGGSATTVRGGQPQGVDKFVAVPKGTTGEPCSFAGTTPVLMGDGTRTPIQDVEVGDKVWAADPVTGERGPREVTVRHVSAAAASAPVHNSGGRDYCDIADLPGDEPDTARRLMRDPDYPRHAGKLRGFKVRNDRPDFIDERGRTYDAVGGPRAWKRPEMGRMLWQIERHIYLKDGINYTVLDLKGASNAQLDAVFARLDALEAGSRTPKSKLIIIGDDN